MNISICKHIGTGFTIAVFGIASVAKLTAQEQVEMPLSIEEPSVVLEKVENHVHGENNDHDHPELKPPTVEEIRSFLKSRAVYILPEFDKVMKANDEEHIAWMVKDISGIMNEHAALENFDPKVAALFTEVLKLENDLHHEIEDMLEAGDKPEAVGKAVKAHLKALVVKRIELEKGQVAYKKYKLDKKLRELEASADNVDEITENELKAIVQELKESHEEGQ